MNRPKKNNLIIAFLVISNVTFANFGGYMRQVSEGAGSLYSSSKNTNVRLVNEIVDIELNQRVLFKAKFVFLNDSNSDENVTLGFPQFSYWEVPATEMGYQPGKYYPLSATLLINGKESKPDNTLFSERLDAYEGVKLYTAKEMEASLIDYARMNEAQQIPTMPILIWELKELQFPSNDTVVVEISFTRPWFYSDELWTFGFRTDGQKSFDYIFETGRTWKNKTIENFSCTIKFPAEAKEYIDFGNQPFQPLSENEIRFEKQNWIPESTENLHIRWLSKFQISAQYPDQLYFDSYNWHHATDGSEKTAWCFREKALKEGEFLVTKINYPIVKKWDRIQPQKEQNPFYVTRIQLVIGFAKDNQTHNANSRPRTIELLYNGIKQRLTLSDTPERQTFELLEKVDINKGITFIFLDCFEGSKFDDICISEIDFS